MNEIEHVRQCSHYLDTLLRNNPENAEWLSDGRQLGRKYPLTGLYAELQAYVKGAESFNDLMRVFRRFKQRHFLRIGARDLLKYGDLAETTGQLSDLASVTLQLGLDMLWANPDWWVWGEELHVWERVKGSLSIAVLGLGKLGGHELNYVSDIDVIFLSSKEDDSEYQVVLLSRLAHWLSRLLADRLDGDRVFQVDFRLRPQGKDGLLVPSMNAAVEYYLLHGQAWERQMLLKCKPVAGDRSTGTAFIQEVRPFVFRRFLDFQALSELREMRNRILTEALRFRPGSSQFDVKLGIGGIREIEFLVQSLQLIYGGRNPELDEPNTLRCLEKLSGLGLLPENTAEELRQSYVFLRNVEHYIQLDQNRQTQKLPRSEDARRRLVLAMGFGTDENGFIKALEEQCSRVQANFASLFEETVEDDTDAELAGHKGSTGTDLMDLLPADALFRFRETLGSFQGAVGREILCSVEKYAQIPSRALQEKTLIRIDNYFGRVVRRPGMTRLFGSVKPWLRPFCNAICSSEFAFGLLTHNPGLVEGIAMAPVDFAQWSEWEASSTKLLQSAKDYEEKLEWIRRLKNERVLELVLHDLEGEIDFGSLEEQHSALADFVIRSTLDAVAQNLGIESDLPLAVLGMGKLGSKEMTYLSDLDLVFVYEPKPDEAENQIPGKVIRLIQRFMNMLNTPLQEGPGYAVDARLRPTGTYGPLVVTKNSWLEYFLNEADIWEIQALLRARVVAGDPALGRWLEDRAEEICYSQRDPESVWPRICHLRDRMEKERSEETISDIDLKLGMGGLADIEFLVQGKLLVEGYRNGSIGLGSVRRAVGEFLKSVCTTSARADEMNAAFGSLRALDHRLRLHSNSTSSKLNEGNFEDMGMLGLWPPQYDAGAIETWQDILRLRREVRSVIRTFCPDLRAM
jgi:[glutamine synthetase] adenylyltransferase / [glutamine synthetase]-adenylyl-L-tyrosine phosphorylase